MENIVSHLRRCVGEEKEKGGRGTGERKALCGGECCGTNEAYIF